jgi:hypothetical protein
MRPSSGALRAGAALAGGGIVAQWLSTALAAAVTGADLDLGDPLLWANVALLGPLALAAVVVLALSVGGVALGAWTLAFWLAAPWLSVPYALPGYRAEAQDLVLPLVLGLTPDRGYAAGAAIVLAAVLATLEGRAAPATAGVLLGAAALLEPATVVFAVAAALGLLVVHRPAAAATLTAAAAPLLAAAAVRHGLDPGPRSVDAFKASMGGLREYMWSQRVLQWLPLAGALALARRSPFAAVSLGGGFVGFALVQTSRADADVLSGAFFRVLLPGLPAAAVAIAAVPLLVPTLAVRLGEWARPLPLR